MWRTSYYSNNLNICTTHVPRWYMIVVTNIYKTVENISLKLYAVNNKG